MSTAKVLAKDDKIGDWTLEFRLGKGGNGDVWSVRRSDDAGKVAAMKFLTKTNRAAIVRFRGEIEVLREHSDVPGLLPALGHHLPDNPSTDGPAWYSMPRAEPLMKALRREPREIITAIVKVAGTLATLHSRGVSHRDIKPDNLLDLNGEPHVADFGLADFPEKAEITGKGEMLGPRWTIAPEMRRSPTAADGRLADVYSLGKTLWILLANDLRCFDGQYTPDDAKIAIKNHMPSAKLLYRLDDLLTQATANNPSDRPTMTEFKSALAEWLAKEREFGDVSLGDWRHFQQKVFPHGVPARAAWQDKNSIVGMLNLLGTTAELNHTFAPDGGGVDIIGASDSFEPDCIELRFEAGITVIVKPKRLMFESFAGNPDWSYFRLETEALEPVFDGGDPFYEEMVELSPRNYIERHWWDLSQYQDGGQLVPLPSTARRASRYLKGSFLEPVMHFCPAVAYV